MTNLEKLVSRCKASVSVMVNNHRDYYESVEESFANHQDFKNDIPTDVFAKMVELDTVVCVHFYPHTPIGFFVVYHYDLETAIQQALDILIKEEEQPT